VLTKKKRDAHQPFSSLTRHSSLSPRATVVEAGPGVTHGGDSSDQPFSVITSPSSELKDAFRNKSSVVEEGAGVTRGGRTLVATE